MTITLHINDLPADLDLGNIVAVDTEMMGLNPHRDRLCVVQLSAGDGNAHLVQFQDRQFNAPHLKKLLSNPDVTKIFHFARSDVASIKQYLDVTVNPIYCTKIASKLARTFTNYHGLKNLCKDVLGVDLDKQQQTSDWGVENLTPEQQAYAASDVLHLHKLKAALDTMLQREGRMEMAQACFNFLPTRAALDLQGWDEEDIFAH